MRNVTVIRSAAVRGFRATVAELGGDAERFAEVVGLPVSALDSDDMLVPVKTVAALFDCAAAKLDCPDLGLRIGARQDLGMLGPLALAIQASATIEEALSCATRYLFVHSPALMLTVKPDPYRVDGVSALQYGGRVNDPIHHQGVDSGMAFLHRALWTLAGGRYGLRSVELAHRPRTAPTVYEEFFGAPVRVERPASLLRVPNALLGRPLRDGGNPHLRQLAEAFLAEQLPPDAAREIAPRVRAAVQRLLGTTRPDIDTVSTMLSLHPRTLQRRLSEEDTTFATLVDDVRRRTARRYLTTTDMPMTQVASLLGFSEQSVLSRSCRRWWSATPLQVRRGRALQT